MEAFGIAECTMNTVNLGSVL